MGEIHKSVELIDNIQPEIEQYKEIEPQTRITPNEARDYLNQLFSKTITESGTLETQNPRIEQLDGKTYYYDDSGKLYRVENELIPNAKYELNGYEYSTDNKGRIISAEGTLRMKEREGRLPIRDSIEDIGKGDQLENDDRGHLIGDQFDGPNGLENMISQDANINRNDFKNFENELAKEVKEGREVITKIEPVYNNESRRPLAIVVSYSIDDEKYMKIFPNG